MGPRAEGTHLKDGQAGIFSIIQKVRSTGTTFISRYCAKAALS